MNPKKELTGTWVVYYRGKKHVALSIQKAIAMMEPYEKQEESKPWVRRVYPVAVRQYTKVAYGLSDLREISEGMGGRLRQVVDINVVRNDRGTR